MNNILIIFSENVKLKKYLENKETFVRREEQSPISNCMHL